MVEPRDKSTKPITKRQQQVLEFIKSFIETNSFPPTVREVMDGTGIYSSSTAQGLINQLIDKGYLTNIPGSPRSLRVTDQPSRNTGELELPSIARKLEIAIGALQGIVEYQRDTDESMLYQYDNAKRMAAEALEQIGKQDQNKE